MSVGAASKYEIFMSLKHQQTITWLPAPSHLKKTIFWLGQSQGFGFRNLRMNDTDRDTVRKVKLGFLHNFFSGFFACKTIWINPAAGPIYTMLKRIKKSYKYLLTDKS